MKVVSTVVVGGGSRSSGFGGGDRNDFISPSQDSVYCK